MSDDPYVDESGLAELRAKIRRDRQQPARRPIVSSPMSNGSSAWARAAFDYEVSALGCAIESTRNDSLNVAAFNLGQLVPHALSEQHVVEALTSVALQIGLTPSETRRTIASGMGKGRAEPRLAPLRLVDDVPDMAGPDFWGSRPLLAHLRLFAQARRASPWAVLGVALARVAYCVPLTSVLPPMVGSAASVNYFVAVVGSSGTGKGAAERVAADALTLPERALVVKVGSGEGIAHTYRRRSRNGAETTLADKVLFSVPEIDTLTALGMRKGATLLPELRSAWSGEALGFAYADETKRIRLPDHGYRLCLVAGVQPERARALLEDADGGTPQRFIWVPASDRAAPEVAPDAPTPMTLSLPRLDAREHAIGGLCWVDVCLSARRTVDDARLASLREQGEALDGHALLLRLKTALLLGYADGRAEIGEEDWQLADIIMRQSVAVRTSMQHRLADGQRQRNLRRAEGDAERAVVVEQRTHEARTARIGRLLLRKLSEAGPTGVKRKAWRDTLASRDRDAFETVVDALLTSGQIERVDSGSSVLYRVAL